MSAKAGGWLAEGAGDGGAFLGSVGPGRRWVLSGQPEGARSCGAAGWAVGTEVLSLLVGCRC